MADHGAVKSDEAHLDTDSPSMRRLWALAARFAPLDATVLITGESGVGKERLARWLHEHSRRANGPYLAINCAAVPDALLETELFGYVRGAFTGAVRDHAGLFEAAQAGSLFLDEIGDVSTSMQVKLLRVLQEREVRRVGDTRTRRVDVRLIAATNRRLREEVAAQRFRQDLYYRLRVVDLHIPPLRERPEDLLRLSHEFLAQAAIDLNRPIRGFTPDALDLILKFSWPGNVRQLEHAIERACAVASELEIRLEDLPDDLRGEEVVDTNALSDLERQHILSVLERTGSKRRAAHELKISKSTLLRKLRKYQQPLGPTAQQQDKPRRRRGS